MDVSTVLLPVLRFSNEASSLHDQCAISMLIAMVLMSNCASCEDHNPRVELTRDPADLEI